MFQKAIQCLRLPFLTFVFSPTKHATYKQGPALAGELFGLLSCLTLFSLTTMRFLSRRESPTHPVNVYTSVSLVPVSIPTLIFWCSPQMLLTQRHTLCLQVKKYSLFEYSWVDNCSSLHRRSHPLTCAIWTEAGS